LHSFKSHAEKMFTIFQEISNEVISEKSVGYAKLGHLLGLVREANIRLERSFTTDHIDNLFTALEPYVSGSHLIGAGAGGYIIGWLKDGVNKEVVQKQMEFQFPGIGVEVQVASYWDGFI